MGICFYSRLGNICGDSSGFLNRCFMNSVMNNVLRGYGDYVECPGVYYINFINGYESFVRKAVSLLPERVLRVNTSVSKIIWSDKRTHQRKVRRKLM